MAPSVLRLTVDHGEDFLKRLKEEMTDELAVASRKWRVELSAEQKTAVLKASYEQLKLRVEHVSNEPWNFTPEVRYSFLGSRGSFTVPSPEASASQIRLIRASDGWQVDQDRGDDSIRIGDFQPVAMNELLTWARTAVFYGVASYKS